MSVGPSNPAFLPRVVPMSPQGLAARLEQSSLGAVYVGGSFQAADFERLVGGHQFLKNLAENDHLRADYLNFLDAADQAAAESLIQALRGDRTKLPPALYGALLAMMHPEAITMTSDLALVQQLERHITEAVESLEITDNKKERLQTALKTPDHVHKRILRIQMDDGQWRAFLAYRVQHNRWLGEERWYGGGVRWQPYVNEFVIRMLGGEMFFKCTAMGLPMGGGKAGIACNPSQKPGESASDPAKKKLSYAEMGRLGRAFSRAFANILVANRDKPAPDIGTSPEGLPLMSIMQDEIDKIYGPDGAPGTYTGKPFVEGVDPRRNGIPGRGKATGQGGWFALEADAEVIGEPIGETFIIQGAGNAGLYKAKIVHASGRKVVVLTDSQGGWYDPNGLDIPRLIRQKTEKLLPGEEPIPQNVDKIEAMRKEADVLVPAAAHWTINGPIAENIRAKMIVELANNPCTDDGLTVLKERELRGELRVLPDFQASGGGVTVSFFEWQQNQGDRIWSEEEVDQKLKERMYAAIQSSSRRARKEGITVREAAWRNTVARAAEKMPEE